MVLPLETTTMNVTFDVNQRSDLHQFRSQSSTLNSTPMDTPQRSRDPSTEGRKKTETTQFDPSKLTIKRPQICLQDELQIEWMGFIIIVCFFTSGLIDAVAFNSWNCFVGMQTGNTVFAALGIGGQPTSSHRQQFYKSLLAIGSFCCGTLFFNLMHRWHDGLAQQPSSRRRWVFVVSFAVQTLFIVIAAILVQLGIVSNRPFVSGSFSSGSHVFIYDGSPRYVDLAPIALLSFEAAGQVCLSRVLSVVELPTIVLSTLYHDFTADLYCITALWKSSSSAKDFFFSKFRRQGKRFLSIVGLFCGALVGGEMYKSATGMAGALWLAAFMKLGVTVAFAFWKSEKKSDSMLPR